MSILNNNSFQKNSTKEGVILGQLFRIFKISTSMADFNKAYLVLKDNLKSNNYDINYIRSLKKKFFINVNFTIENQLLIKGHKSCNSYKLCKNYNEEKHILEYNKQTKYILKYSNCKTSNIIYGISCNMCNLLYIGKSENQFKTRIGAHISKIKTQSNECTLYQHFQNKSCFKNFSTFIIDYNPRWNHKQILKKEGYYQKLFNTLKPGGLNDINNITYNKYDFPFKIPYGTAGIHNLNVYQNTNLIYTGHKNLTRIFHHQKFN